MTSVNEPFVQSIARQKKEEERKKKKRKEGRKNE